MRKLILAIIAVICVDIGFVAYKSAGDQAVSKNVNVPDNAKEIVSNSPNDPIEMPQPADELTTADPSAEVEPVRSDIVEPARQTQLRANRNGRTSIVRSYTAKLHLPENKTDGVLPVRVDLPNTIIYYSGQKPANPKVDQEVAGERVVDRHFDVSGQPVRTPPRSENRSLIARAWPIIKKPYDWIKAVGSRLY